MKEFWSNLGGKLGVGLVGAGFLFVFLGWNGAASVDRVPSQFPYLISGGVAGMCLVICGIGLIVVQNQRADRAELQQTIRELRQAMADAGLAESVGETRQEFSPPTPRPTPDHVASALRPTDASEPTEPVEVAVPDADVAQGEAESPEPGDRLRPVRRRAPLRAE